MFSNVDGAMFRICETSKEPLPSESVRINIASASRPLSLHNTEVPSSRSRLRSLRLNVHGQNAPTNISNGILCRKNTPILITPYETPHSTSPFLPEQVQDPEGAPNMEIVVSEKVAAICVSLLSDACGYTAHPNIHAFSCCFEGVGAGMMRRVLQSVSQEELKRMKLGEKEKKAVKYISLIPVKLRSRVISVPEMDLMANDNSGCRMIRRFKVELDIKKPARIVRNKTSLFCAFCYRIMVWKALVELFSKH